MMFAPLTDYSQRHGAEHSAAGIVNGLRGQLFMIPGALIVPLEPPAIQGIGSFGGFQFELQDLGGNTVGDLDRVAHTIVAMGGQRKDLTGLFTSFTSNDPQVLVNIDREKAKAMGVPFSQISDALQVYMGSEYVNNFDFNNRSYRVDVQADQQFRQNAADIRQYYVRSNTNQMIPLDNLVTITQTSGPQVISHYNLFRAAEIDGSAAPGVSSSQGLKAMEEVAHQNMLHGMSFE
jgi:HAE1 family hydrophobic/amphiphilic exporter-1